MAFKQKRAAQAGFCVVLHLHIRCCVTNAALLVLAVPGLGTL